MKERRKIDIYFKSYIGCYLWKVVPSKVTYQLLFTTDLTLVRATKIAPLPLTSAEDRPFLLGNSSYRNSKYASSILSIF